MAVVTEYGSLSGNAAFRQIQTANGAATYDFADHRLTGGQVHSYLEKIDIDIGDEATSVYYVAKLPREAVLLPSTSYQTDALVTGSIDLGDANDVDGLIDAGDPTAGVQTFLPDWTGGTYADMGTALWEVLGYATADAAPEEIEIYATLNTSTQADAAAQVWFHFMYTY